MNPPPPPSQGTSTLGINCQELEDQMLSKLAEDELWPYVKSHKCLTAALKNLQSWQGIASEQAQKEIDASSRSISGDEDRTHLEELRGSRDYVLNELDARIKSLRDAVQTKVRSKIQVSHEMMKEVRESQILTYAKDWLDALLDRTTKSKSQGGIPIVAPTTCACELLEKERTAKKVAFAQSSKLFRDARKSHYAFWLDVKKPQTCVQSSIAVVESWSAFHENYHDVFFENYDFETADKRSVDVVKQQDIDKEAKAYLE